MYLKMPSAQWRQYRLSLNVLKLGNVPEADIKADSVLLRISMLSQVIFLACWWLILIPYIASKVYVELQ